MPDPDDLPRVTDDDLDTVEPPPVMPTDAPPPKEHTSD